MKKKEDGALTSLVWMDIRWTLKCGWTLTGSNLFGLTWANFDNYIEDGELVLPVKIFCWVGLSEGVARPIEDKQIFFRVERTDSFSLDSKQNLVWKTILTSFKYNQKVTHTRKLKRVTPNSTSLGWQCLLM